MAKLKMDILRYKLLCGDETNLK
ncbi:serine acetyltransferase, partial [Escherichia coli]